MIDMKKILLVTLLVLFSALMHMSAEDVKVTMKNGTVFTGVLKEFDPTDHVTVIVAGIEKAVGSIWDTTEGTVYPGKQNQSIE